MSLVLLAHQCKDALGGCGVCLVVEIVWEVANIVPSL